MKMGTNLALLLARMKAITIMSSLISLVARSHDCALRVFNSAGEVVSEREETSKFKAFGQRRHSRGALFFPDHGT
jgi:hypothetical protein